EATKTKTAQGGSNKTKSAQGGSNNKRPADGSSGRNVAAKKTKTINPTQAYQTTQASTATAMRKNKGKILQSSLSAVRSLSNSVSLLPSSCTPPEIDPEISIQETQAPQTRDPIPRIHHKSSARVDHDDATIGSVLTALDMREYDLKIRRWARAVA
ncbi:hypothetical protein Tco_0789306, partial [Tanacetum coccineum]